MQQGRCRGWLPFPQLQLFGGHEVQLFTEFVGGHWGGVAARGRFLGGDLESFTRSEASLFRFNLFLFRDRGGRLRYFRILLNLFVLGLALEALEWEVGDVRDLTQVDVEAGSVEPLLAGVAADHLY